MKFVFKGFQQCFFREFLAFDFWNLRDPPKPTGAVPLDVGSIGLLKNLVMNFDLLYFFHVYPFEQSWAPLESILIFYRPWNF